MANTGNAGSRPESRKKPRRQFHYGASILTEPGKTPLECMISDVSEGGARLVLDEGEELPPRFVLLLTKEGSARRTCRVIWRNGSNVGVAFTNGDL